MDIKNNDLDNGSGGDTNLFLFWLQIHYCVTGGNAEAKLEPYDGRVVFQFLVAE